VESFLREVNLPTIVHGVREALGMAGARSLPCGPGVVGCF